MIAGALAIGLVVAALAIAGLLVYVRQLESEVERLSEARDEWFDKSIQLSFTAGRRLRALRALSGIVAVDEEGVTLRRGPDEYGDAWALAAAELELDPATPPVYKTGSVRVVIRA